MPDYGLDRRTFILGAAAASISAATGSNKLSETEKTISIVDTHQHLWDFHQFRPPWLKSEPKINHSMGLAEYAEATHGLNVVHTIYMEVDVDPKDQLREAEYVIGLCKDPATKMAGAVISGRPANSGFRKYAARFKNEHAIRGFRQVLQVPEDKPGLCLTQEFIKSIRYLGEIGKSFDICIRPAELSDAAKLVDLCPQTRFVLDHCGNADASWSDRKKWEHDTSTLAGKANVVCKVSGIIKTGKPDGTLAHQLEPIVKHVLGEFGPDRVMFGGDWPVCNLTTTFSGWVKALKWIVRDFGIEDQQKLFAGNAIAFYGIRPNNVKGGAS